MKPILLTIVVLVVVSVVITFLKKEETVTTPTYTIDEPSKIKSSPTIDYPCDFETMKC